MRAIEDHHHNYTRFLLLEKNAGEVAGAPPFKTTVLFRTPNSPGALFRALAAFALRDINLSKIESRPRRGHPWEYVFYVDFLMGDDEPARKALDHLREISEFVKVLGIYPAAE
jgi:prephenate dehydratase